MLSGPCSPGHALRAMLSGPCSPGHALRVMLSGPSSSSVTLMATSAVAPASDGLVAVTSTVQVYLPSRSRAAFVFNRPVPGSVVNEPASRPPKAWVIVSSAPFGSAAETTAPVFPPAGVFSMISLLCAVGPPSVSSSTGATTPPAKTHHQCPVHFAPLTYHNFWKHLYVGTALRIGQSVGQTRWARR